MTTLAETHDLLANQGDSDDDSMRAYYGRTVGFRPVLTGQVKDPNANDVFLATLRKNRTEVNNAQAH